MSDESARVTLAKWPFYLADVVLSGVVFFVLYQLGTFEGTPDIVIVALCLVAAVLAAWISILPWLKEHDASAQLTDSTNLKSSLEQIKGVEKVADLIRQSNGQWQAVQDASGRTVAAAQEVTEKMKIEAEEFMKFMAQTHDQERAGLRLEVEKLRRMEGDWIKVTVGMLDHTFAIFRAAERSGQKGLISQLGQFQNACRDVARRMGLTPFMPVAGESFDARAHQLADPKLTAQEGAKIQQILASGFTYQGQLLRRALVMLEGSEPAADESNAPSAEDDDGGTNVPVAPEPEVPPDPPVAAVYDRRSPSTDDEAMPSDPSMNEDGGPAPAEPPQQEVAEQAESSRRASKKISPQDELPF